MYVPKHRLFLRDFTKNPSGVVSDSCKSSGMTLATPYFTGSVKRKKKKSRAFAKSPGGWEKEKKEVNLARICFEVFKTG
jgi:hypothetical protein